MTTTLTPAPSMAITGWGVVSPWGTDTESFIHGLAGFHSAAMDASSEFDEELPSQQAYMLPGLVAKDHLGRKGSSTLDRTTVLTLIASAQALAGHEDAPDRTRFGMVLGTTAGSTRSTSDYSKATFVEDRPYLVNPLLFPNAVMNCAAGQTAIRHGLRGVNATIAGGATAVLSALRYANRLMRQGHADQVLIGATEEYSPQWAWENHYTYGDDAVGAGEGCAMFVVQPIDHVTNKDMILGQVLATRVFGYDGEQPLKERLEQCLRLALADAALTPEDVAAVLSAENNTSSDKDEDDAITAVVGASCPRIRIKQVLGEARSASTALQIAAALSLHRQGTCPPGAIFAVTSHTPDGNVGVTIIRGGSDE